MVDKLVSQTQETLKTVSLDANHNKCDLENASKVIKDAENSKHVSDFSELKIQPLGLTCFIHLSKLIELSNFNSCCRICTM